MGTLVSFNCTGEAPGETRVELDGLSGVFTVMGAPAGMVEPAARVKVLQDLEYGHYTLNDVQHPLYLDLYLPQPELIPPPPLIIYLHGGGWVEGSKNNGSGLATALAEEGFAVACVDYRLAACCEGACRDLLRFPSQIQDVKAAVRWLRGHAYMYGFDPERFGAMGDSSGGHLAALLGTSQRAADLEGDQNPGPSDAVQAVCDWYGPVDVTSSPPEILFDEDPCRVGLDYLVTRYGGEERPYFYWTLVWATFLGGSLTDPMVVARARQASPLTYIDAADPPFLVIHGEDDSIIPIDQSEMLVDALERVGVEVNFIRLPRIGHSFAAPMGTDLEVDPAFFEPSIRFFDRYLGQD
jgi:acetyl esterase/lipase